MTPHQAIEPDGNINAVKGATPLTGSRVKVLV
jgi:hypothetical protein